MVGDLAGDRQVTSEYETTGLKKGGLSRGEFSLKHMVCEKKS